MKEEKKQCEIGGVHINMVFLAAGDREVLRAAGDALFAAGKEKKAEE